LHRSREILLFLTFFLSLFTKILFVWWSAHGWIWRVSAFIAKCSPVPSCDHIRRRRTSNGDFHFGAIRWMGDRFLMPIY
jgi:hypothetical protein